MIDKKLVAKRFNRSISSYDAHAHAQRLIAERMLEATAKYAPNMVRNIAEIGCGTGIYSKMLLREFQPQTLWLNDICADLGDYYDNFINKTINFNCGDAETMDLPLGQDIVTSCSTVQWFASPKNFFDRIKNCLNAEGVLSFSTFLPGNLYEVEEIGGAGLKYLKEDDYKMILHDNYSILSMSTEDIVLHFDSGLEVLRHLRATGVTGISAKCWTPRRLYEFCAEYKRRFSQNGKVTLTYRPLYVIAKPLNN